MSTLAMAAELGGLTRPPTPTRSLHMTNSLKSKSSAYHSAHSVYNDMRTEKATKTFADYQWDSSATDFARSTGIKMAGKPYYRCPLSGTWYEDKPEKRRSFHQTTSNLTMRFTEVPNHKPYDSHQPKVIWAAPCLGNGTFWVHRRFDPPRSMVLGHDPDVRGLLAHPMNRSSSEPGLRSSR
mmetsp:Transcript_55919/g.121002  ORF Transcript_55919/g.121002 Transcript_55919/m.121002 type:complete len:181 (-) Transcript_55919:157-699(-)|eukprot:CAMPEP_0170612890 /NCGR_PEP_ID=MMETSP0224-20130122/23971_1 /TAXON_ID=285029 /ORGANISM="Togula jolla, Strain CCCM 725" /LENGTH=180 /DNA_ID=CAMNT_0010938437 /DNA_START=57 /DNA_END=599 /DNA_ORIENTATION=+